MGSGSGQGEGSGWAGPHGATMALSVGAASTAERMTAPPTAAFLPSSATWGRGRGRGRSGLGVGVGVRVGVGLQ